MGRLAGLLGGVSGAAGHLAGTATSALRAGKEIVGRRDGGIRVAGEAQTPTAGERALIARPVVYDIERPSPIGAGSVERRKQSAVGSARGRGIKCVARVGIRWLVSPRRDLRVSGQALGCRIVKAQNHIIRAVAPADVRH